MSESYSPEKIEKLVVKAQKGHQESFAKLYDIFFDKIWRYVSFRVSAEEVEDIVGDVFLKLVQHLKKYKPQSSASFSAWFYRIAHNTIIDFYRKKKDLLGLDSEDEDFFAQIPDEVNLRPDQSTNQTFEHAKIHKALKKLSPINREILELKFLEGFSNTEIAQVTGKTEGNIRIIQLRALREMRKYFRASSQ